MYLALKILLDWIGIGSSSNELNGPIDVAPSLAVGVTATANAAAFNDTGTIVEIVAADAIVEDFLVRELVVDTISADDDYQVTLFTGASGSEVEFAVLKFSGAADLRIPVGRRLSGGDRVSARIACLSANARTAKLSIGYIAWSA